MPLPPGTAGRADTFRIYVLGESTSEGLPYEQVCNFGKIVAFLFDGQIAGRPIEVVNLAKAGKDAAYSLERARSIAESEPEPEHAVVLVYCGQNEFLKHDSEHDLSRYDRALFDVPLVDPATREAVYANFERSITAIVDVLEAKHIAVVLSTQAVNLADWEPNRSVLEDPAHEAAVQQALDRGEELLRAGDAGEAAAAFGDAVALEPHFAWANARLGSALRAAGRNAEALAAFHQADEWDARPDSATSRQQEFLRRLTRERGLALVDAEKIVQQADDDGLPGYALFFDNCHPRLAGYGLIGAGFADEIARLFHTPRARAELDVAAMAQEFGIDERFNARAALRQGQYCYGQSTVIWNPRARLDEARRLLEIAFEVLGSDGQLLCAFAVLETIEGDMAKSRAAWRRAFEADEALTRKQVRNPRVRELLQGRGVADPMQLFEN